MSTGLKNVKRVTTHVLLEMKASGQPIAMLTAYDYSLARLVDAAGIDVILVGDSASNVMAGHETTLPITLDQMIYHASAVCARLCACAHRGGPAFWYLPRQ
jgi:3-methyl-2-oxobutanoate hydroxymethyltransferase